MFYYPERLCRTTLNFGTQKDDILHINHLAPNNYTETFSKMASTLYQKLLTIFCQKALNFV